MSRYEFKVSPTKDPDLVAWLDSLYNLDGGFSFHLRFALRAYLSGVAGVVDGAGGGNSRVNNGAPKLPRFEVAAGRQVDSPGINSRPISGQNRSNHPGQNRSGQTSQTDPLPEIVIDTSGMFSGAGSGGGKEASQPSDEDLLAKLNNVF